MEYLVDTNHYVIANKKALEQLKIDLVPMAEQFREPREKLLSYYDGAVMADVDLIK